MAQTPVLVRNMVTAMKKDGKSPKQYFGNLRNNLRLHILPNFHEPDEAALG